MGIWTGTVVLKAVTAPGPQVWSINGGAVDAEDAVSLVGTPGGNISEITNNAVQFFAMSDAVNSVPDNATITNVQINIIGDGNPGGQCFVRWGIQTDLTFAAQRANNNQKDYPDLTDFGNPGVPWTRGLINSNNFDLICGNTGLMVVDDYYIVVTFTVPEIATPTSAVITGGTTIDFELSSGTIFDAFYEVTFNPPGAPVALTVIDPTHGQGVTTVLTGFPFPSSWSITLADPEDDVVTGLRPYNNPRLTGTLTGLENDYMQFLEDPTGSPSAAAVTGGITMGSSYVGYLSKDISGIYTLVADQRFDRVYVRAGSTLTQDVQIPNPFAELGFTECDDE